MDESMKGEALALLGHADFPDFAKWPDDLRAIPNVLIRGSLFSISRHTETDRVIATPEGTTFKYKGVPLDQSHLDVFAAVTHLARGLEADAVIRTTRYELLKTMGWNQSHAGPKGFEWIWKRLSDLTAGTIIVEQDKRRLAAGSLLASAIMSEGSEQILIRMNHLVRPMFDMSTHLNSVTRRSLTSPLDKWLHAVLTSHASPFPMTVQTYRRLSGSLASVKEFKRQLRESLDRLKAKGIVEVWEMRNELVHIQRKPTKAQIRYLANVKNGDGQKRTRTAIPGGGPK